MEDWGQLDAGEAAAEELDDQDCLVGPRALAENPDGKRAALRPVFRQIAELQTKRQLPLKLTEIDDEELG